MITGENGRAAKTYLSLADVAEIYGYTRKAVQDMARRGVLPGAKKCGSRWRVKRERIEKAWGD